MDIAVAAHLKGKRARGARGLVDELIERGSWKCWTSTNAYYRCIDVVRAHTDLLKHSRVSSQEGRGFVERVIDGLTRLVSHRRRWQRKPEYYYPDKVQGRHQQWCRFVGHLLSEYPTPDFMALSWLAEERSRWHEELHLHLGKGLSVRNASLPNHWRCDKATARFFMQAPNDMSVEQSFRWAQVMAIAKQFDVHIEPKHARRLAIAVPMCSDSVKEHFWQETMRFFVRNPVGGVELREMIDVIQKLRFTPASEVYPYCRMRTPLAPKLEIASRTLRSFRRIVCNWRRDYYPGADQMDEDCRMEKPWPASTVGRYEFFQKVGDPSQTESIKWEIIQLRTRRELRIEGGILNHCVGEFGYDEDCARGKTEIWSLRKWNNDKMKRAVTIELLPSKVVVQARGKSNRSPTELESRIIHEWAAANRLVV